HASARRVLRTGSAALYLRVDALHLSLTAVGGDSRFSRFPIGNHPRKAYHEAGGNFIDTANVYTNCSSEQFVGEFIKDHRQSMVLSTKYSNAMPGKDPNAAGNHRKSLIQAVDASLSRLQTDYIDLYWVHIWDQMTPVEEVMRGLDELALQGKILYTGISDAPAWWIAQANTLAELRGWSRFVGLQIEYSLIQRTV